MPTELRMVAVLDVGTNTFKLSVFRVEHGAIVELATANRVMRVASLIDDAGYFPSSALDAIVGAVSELAAIGRRAGADTFVGVATQGFRSARNGDEALARITRETPWRLRLISGDEESGLTFAGLVDRLPTEGNALIVDIGGGSTELVYASARRLVASESLRVGSGVLTDRFVCHDPPLPEELDAAAAEADVNLAATSIPVVTNIDSMLLAGGAGQFLEAIVQRTLHSVFGVATLHALQDVLLTTNADDLATTLDIPVNRAQVIPAGHRIALAAFARFRPAAVEAVPSGIRLGIVRHLLTLDA